MQSFEEKKEIIYAERRTDSEHTRRMVLTGVLFAVAIVLSFIESQFPPLFAAVPGMRFGLSNIVVMFCLICLDKRQALLLAVMKSFFVLITRGAIAAALSLSGGLFSILIMVVLMTVFRGRISYAILSMFGAIAHNIGQFAVVSLLFIDIFVWAYLPVLILFGVGAGLLTSILLKFVLPILHKIF